MLDVWLQGSRLDGLGILKALHREEPHVPVVMISGHGTIEMAVTAIQQGAYDFLEKPFQSDRLLLVMPRALWNRHGYAPRTPSCGCAPGRKRTLSGASPAINAGARPDRNVWHPPAARVLITGPAGSGKEVAARMIHTPAPAAPRGRLWC